MAPTFSPVCPRYSSRKFWLIKAYKKHKVAALLEQIELQLLHSPAWRSAPASGLLLSCMRTHATPHNLLMGGRHASPWPWLSICTRDRMLRKQPGRRAAWWGMERRSTVLRILTVQRRCRDCDVAQSWQPKRGLESAMSLVWGWNFKIFLVGVLLCILHEKFITVKYVNLLVKVLDLLDCYMHCVAVCATRLTVTRASMFNMLTFKTVSMPFVSSDTSSFWHFMCSSDAWCLGQITVAV